MRTLSAALLFAALWLPAAGAPLVRAKPPDTPPAAIFTVPVSGGLPTRLPLAYGADGAFSPDGRWLAYTPMWPNNRTWKRYAGGMAQHLWLLDLGSRAAKRVTMWEGTSARPMWRGSTLYYLSDEGRETRLNLWAFDTRVKTRRQVTHFRDYDAQNPSIGPGPNGRGE